MKVLATICLLLVHQEASAAPDTVIQAGEQAVLSAYKPMEWADRKGDGQLWFSLRDRKTQDTMNQALKDAIRKGGHSRPRIQYQPLAQRVDKNRAIILGKVSDPDAGTVQYDAVLFAIEDGGWKVNARTVERKTIRLVRDVCIAGTGGWLVRPRRFPLKAGPIRLSQHANGQKRGRHLENPGDRRRRLRAHSI